MGKRQIVGDLIFAARVALDAIDFPLAPFPLIVVGGVCLIEAANLDEVIELAAGIPVVRFGGTVEVRPVVAR